MTVSRHVHRLGAFFLLLVVAWMVVRLGLFYASGRLQLSSERREIQDDYRQLLDRRLDIPVLQRQLSLLSTSSQVRASMIEAPNNRAAFIKLQQISRNAVEEAKGKLLSTIESNTGQLQDTVTLLIRARFPESAVSHFLSNIENGNPRLRVEDITLTSRSTKAGDLGDVEITATIRGQWLAAGKEGP
jgi:hypothetical protein